MKPTRVDTQKLKKTVAGVEKDVTAAGAALEEFLVMLTDQERLTTLKPRKGFVDAARTLTRALPGHPTVTAAADFDAEAVSEDLDNAEALAGLEEQLTHLLRKIADSRMAWLSEAYVPSLAAYAIAKVQARTNGELRAVVQPMAAVFATRRAPADDTSGTPV